MRIAVDAMGGDFAPQNIVAGAVDALRHGGPISRLYLVGDKARVEAEVKKHGATDHRLEIVHASGTGVYHRWGLTGFPETFILDRTGHVVHHFPGQVSAADVEGQIRPLLGSPA